MNNYMVVRDGVWGREYYKWSDAINDVVWLRGPSGATRWSTRDDAVKVALLHRGARAYFKAE